MSADIQAAPSVATPTNSSAPDMQVACFGRYMIDVPPGAEVLGLNSTYWFGDISSERTMLDDKGFEALMLKREEVVKNKEIDYFKHDETRRFGKGSDWLFISSQDAFGSIHLRLEAHALRNGVHFSVVTNGMGRTKDADIAEVKDALFDKIRARQPDEIPTDPGLCIQDGFIASEGSRDHGERVEIAMRFKRWPDVIVTVNSQMIYVSEPSLLERLNSATVPALLMSVFTQMKTLRRGEHEVGTLKGGETLELLPTEAGFKVHSFTWESNFVVRDPYKPALTVSLASGRTSDGDKQRPTISDQDAIQLFDAVVNSIRLRPTSAPPTKVSTAPPLTPLGDLQSTGRTCPQTGWWQSSEDGQQVQGGTRQFFRAGERLPHAVVLGEPSMWQKLKGEQPSYRVATVWKLVGYEASAIPGDTHGAVPAAPYAQPQVQASSDSAKNHPNDDADPSSDDRGRA